MSALSTLSGFTLLVRQGGHHASRSLYSRAMRLLRLIPDAMLDLAAPQIVRVNERIATRLRRAVTELEGIVAQVDGLAADQGHLDPDGAVIDILEDVLSEIAQMSSDVTVMLCAVEQCASVRIGVRKAALLTAMKQSLEAMETARLVIRDLEGAILSREADVEAFKRATMHTAGLKALSDLGWGGADASAGTT